MKTFRRNLNKAAKLDRRDESRAFNRRELVVAVGFLVAGMVSAAFELVGLIVK